MRIKYIKKIESIDKRAKGCDSRCDGVTNLVGQCYRNLGHKKLMGL